MFGGTAEEQESHRCWLEKTHPCLKNGVTGSHGSIPGAAWTRGLLVALRGRVSRSEGLLLVVSTAPASAPGHT